MSLHNLSWLADLVGRARQAVLDGTFGELSAEVARTWGRDLPVVGEAEPLG